LNHQQKAGNFFLLLHEQVLAATSHQTDGDGSRNLKLKNVKTHAKGWEYGEK
jgi:hypothetical protein